MTKLQSAFEKFDTYNKLDPHVFLWEGQSYPREYFLAVKLYEWLLRVEPEASEVLLLASRSQHIGRWTIPREDYPEGRTAYLKWRADLAIFHAQKSGELLAEAGYDEETISRVQQIVLKKRIKLDPEVQAIENALCLVFLQYQYEEFHLKHTGEKVINILRKSLLKMDAQGHQFALAMNFSEKGQYYIHQALERL